MTPPNPTGASGCADGGEAGAGAASSAAAPRSAVADRPASDNAEAAVAALEGEIEVFSRDMAACEQEIRRLMAAEDPAAGVFFARELHAARHEKMRLVTEIQLRRVRINRLRLGIVESMPPNISKGFPF